jgi:hypothetical protein
VPVKYVELSEAEERLALATLDPLTYMAETDAAALAQLLEGVNTGDAALQEVLAKLAETVVTPNDADWANAFGGLPDEDRAPFQQMTFTLHDTQAEVVKRAVALAFKRGDFSESLNENGNGNGLWWICQQFIEATNGQG